MCFCVFVSERGFPGGVKSSEGWKSTNAMSVAKYCNPAKERLQGVSGVRAHRDRDGEVGIRRSRASSWGEAPAREGCR